FANCFLIATFLDPEQSVLGTIIDIKGESGIGTSVMMAALREREKQMTVVGRESETKASSIHRRIPKERWGARRPFYLPYGAAQQNSQEVCSESSRSGSSRSLFYCSLHGRRAQGTGSKGAIQGSGNRAIPDNNGTGCTAP